MAHFIDKDALVEKIDKRLEERQDARDEARWNDEYWPESDFYIRDKEDEELLTIINTLEVTEVIAEQECTCNEALNRIIGGSWNLLCPVNKLGLKTGDKVKVIIKAQKGK